MSKGLAARISGTDVISDAASRVAVVNPSDQTQIAITGSASRVDVVNAVQAAHAGWHEWRQTPAPERAMALRALAADLRADADPLAHIITAETGKLLSEARAEIDLSCRYLEWFSSIVPTNDSGRAGTRSYVARHPVGVVAAITTWNFPLSIPVRKLAPALAAGCTVVLKPSPLSPVTALELVRRCERYLPPGVVGLVLGEQDQGRVLVQDPVVKMVTFTGSTDNGVDIATRLASRLTRSLLELGGRAPAVVLPDADIEQAAETVIQAKFRNNGASCIAANNVFIHEDIFRPLLAALEDRVQALVPGDPAVETTTLGPMRTPQLARNIEKLTKEAEQQGCRVVRGRRPEAASSCYTSAVLVHADRDTTSWNSEVYGPLLQVRGYRDTAPVVELINSWQRGLGGYIVGTDTERAATLAQELRIGMVGIGTATPNSPELPFGGFDLAGWGREGSTSGLDPFLEHQSIVFGS